MSGHDVELDQLRAGVSCAALLERLQPGWLLDKEGSTPKCLKYRRGSGEVLIINHGGRGWWDPMWDDPLPRLDGLQPWEPWPAPTAAALFLGKLRELDDAAHVEAPADLTAVMEREATLARLGAAFSRLPPGTRRRCARPLTGNSLKDTFVFVEADDISQQHVEGVIVDGERDEDGQWLLDGAFTVFTTDEELVIVNGWNCTTEIQ